MPFDPDAFLSGKPSQAASSGFDPDAFLKGEPKADPMAEYKTFRDKYLADAKQGVGTKLADRTADTLGIVGNVIKSAASVPFNLAKGAGELAGEASASDHPINTFNQNSDASTLEAAGRTIYDTLNSGRQLVQRFNDEEALKKTPLAMKLLAGPLAPLIPIGRMAAKAVTPYQPSEEEIQKAYDREQANKAYERKGNVTDTSAIPITGNVNEATAQGLTDLPNALLAFEGAGALKGGVQNLMARKPSNVLAKISKPTPSELSFKSAVSDNKFDPALEKIRQEYKPNTGSDGFLDAAQGAMDKAADTFEPIVKNSGPIDKTKLLNEFESKLSEFVPNPEKRFQALNEVVSDLDTVNDKNLLSYAKSKNKEVANYYKNPDSYRQENFYANKVVRDVFANEIAQRLKAAGVDPKVYSDYGKIRDLHDRIGEQRIKTAFELNQDLGSNPLERAIQGADKKINSVAAIAKGAQRAFVPTFGSDYKALQKGIEDMMRPGSKRTPMSDLEKSIAFKAALDQINRKENQ